MSEKKRFFVDFTLSAMLPVIAETEEEAVQIAQSAPASAFEEFLDYNNGLRINPKVSQSEPLEEDEDEQNFWEQDDYDLEDNDAA